MSAGLTFGLAVPAWRNVAGLRRCLRAAERAAPGLLERAVVVDDSGDGRAAAAAGPEFPAVRWIVHRANRGFGASASEAVLENPADVVVLLNDDVEILNDPIPELRRAFARDDLFAATFLALDAREAFREGAKRLAWPMGMPRILHNERDQRPAEGGFLPSDYAVGGHAAFHRGRFADLGGFDPLFAPFYWEDADLCRRARRRGWLTIHLPGCRVRHAGESAIRSSHEVEMIRETTLCNRLLFAWRHLPRGMEPLHGASLAWLFAASLLSGDPEFRRAFRAARRRWKGVPRAFPGGGGADRPGMNATGNPPGGG